MAKKPVKKAAKKTAKKYVVACDKIHLDDGTTLVNGQPIPFHKNYEASGQIKSV